MYDLSFRMKCSFCRMWHLSVRRLPDVIGPGPSVTLDKQLIQFYKRIIKLKNSDVNSFFLIKMIENVYNVAISTQQ